MEEWRPIPGYEAFYEVSNTGRIRNIRTSKILRLHVNRGYLYILLYYASSPARRFAIHRLVFMAFLGPIPLGKDINHLNGDKADNHLNNLEIATRQENMHHAYTVLQVQRPRGSNNPMAILTEVHIPHIRIILASGMRYPAIARYFRVRPDSIGKIARGETWSHVVDGPKTFPKHFKLKYLPDDIRATICQRYANGESHKTLAAACRLSKTTVGRIVKGTRRMPDPYCQHL